MPTITWPDLFVQDPALDFERLLSLWPHTVSGPLRPIGLSAFGDAYFERPTGHIERLNVLEGGVQRIAPNATAFAELMNAQLWQEENLLSQAVALLIERGLCRGPLQCFALVPHPVFSGKLDFERCMTMDAYPWHVICSQLLDSPPTALNVDSESTHTY